MYLTIQFVLRI